MAIVPPVYGYISTPNDPLQRPRSLMLAKDTVHRARMQNVGRVSTTQPFDVGDIRTRHVLRAKHFQANINSSR